LTIEPDAFYLTLRRDVTSVKQYDGRRWYHPGTRPTATTGARRALALKSVDNSDPSRSTTAFRRRSPRCGRRRSQPDVLHFTTGGSISSTLLATAPATAGNPRALLPFGTLNAVGAGASGRDDQPDAQSGHRRLAAKLIGLVSTNPPSPSVRSPLESCLDEHHDEISVKAGTPATAVRYRSRSPMALRPTRVPSHPCWSDESGGEPLLGT